MACVIRRYVSGEVLLSRSAKEADACREVFHHQACDERCLGTHLFHVARHSAHTRRGVRRCTRFRL